MYFQFIRLINKFISYDCKLIVYDWTFIKLLNEVVFTGRIVTSEWILQNEFKNFR